ncbi:hypothetical protein JW823_06535 [bacterium]|nr:hypothetical protein [candidate division CSSED10-310 bacterium]
MRHHFIYLNLVFWAIGFIVVLMPITGADAKEGYILEDEFAGLLFDRLEIADKSEVLTKAQKIMALEELRFAPDDGYQEGEQLLCNDLVQILIRVYGLEKELPQGYSMEDAFRLLVERKILKEDEDKLEGYVLYIRAELIISQIEPVPQYRPGLILLPRVPSGPSASPIE